MVLQGIEDIQQFNELLLDGYYCEAEELLIHCNDNALLSKGLHTLCNVCLPHLMVINVKGCSFDNQLLNELFMYGNFPVLKTICEIESIIDSSVNEQPSSINNTQLSKDESFTFNTVSFDVKQESMKACYKREMYPALSFSIQCTKGKRIDNIPKGDVVLQYNNAQYSFALPKSNVQNEWKAAIANVLNSSFLNH